jgi:D-glycero-D-manno-heptose 1,7-bisphosphate phosphatase
VKLIILERDGVIGDAQPGAARSPDDWRPIPGAAEAVARLVHAGYRVVLLADQPARTPVPIDMATLNTAHGRLLSAIDHAGGRVDAIFFRPPDDSGTATFRTILERLRMAPEQAILVGDSLELLESAREARLRTVLVLSGNGRRALESGRLPDGTLVRVDLSAVASDLAC